MQAGIWSHSKLTISTVHQDLRLGIIFPHSRAFQASSSLSSRKFCNVNKKKLIDLKITHELIMYLFINILQLTGVPKTKAFMISPAFLLTSHAEGHSVSFLVFNCSIRQKKVSAQLFSTFRPLYGTQRQNFSSWILKIKKLYIYLKQKVKWLTAVLLLY